MIYSDPESSMESSSIVQLTDNDLLGTGTRRHCYAYPGKPAYCIKVPKADKKNSFIQQCREVKYYNKLEKRGVPMSCISRYHGTVETSHGPGYLYDAIRDYDGDPSLQMIDYMRNEPERRHEFLKIFTDLESYLFDNLVIVYDISPYNILCRKNENGKLEPVIIDGVGDVVFIKILNLSKTLVRQKIRRRWMRMVNKLRNEFDWMTGYDCRH